MQRGRAIAFEGGDGMGKATQSKLLADKLGAKLFSFPRYETEVGQAIRGSCRGDWATIQMDRRYEDRKINALARQALFLLDRCDAAPEIERFLANGTDVVFDRYWPSGVVYGADDGLDPQLLIRAHSVLPQPDVWFLLDGPVVESFRRRPERQDNYERDAAGAARRRQAYLELFCQRERFMHKGACPASTMNKGVDNQCVCDVKHWYVLDGANTVESVHADVLRACRAVFGDDFGK